MTFWQSDTYKIVKAMKATGNRPGVIEHWRKLVEAWASNTTGPDVEAVKTWLPMWQSRPYYTAAELAPIFPLLPIALGWAMRPSPKKSAARLAHELDYAGLPKFDRDGQIYYVVEQIHRAKEFANA